MTRSGIDNPWRDGGEPEPLAAWLAAGFEREDAELWRSWRFTIAAARAWRSAGIEDGLRAAQWSTARVTPATVQDWRAAGIDATEAVAWHEFGFGLTSARQQKAKGLGPAEAWDRQQQTSHASAVMRLGAGPLGRFLRDGVPPHIAQEYVSRGWHDDEGLEWAKAGVAAGDARTWRMLGLHPGEAQRLAKTGLSPTDVVRDWWQAGIPLDEVAAWLGAGLTAEEAAAQRARGITAEQAAALRALRDDPDDQP